MDDMTALEGWANFYVIVGSAAGALIGLQFVVLTLIAERPPLHAAEAGAAFATLLLLFVGIHSAWDAVTYHVLVSRGKQRGVEPPTRS
jgi:uncharacterized membrane protein